MLQPEHLRSAPPAQYSPRRFISIGLVALFHLFVIYAFASGLANRLVEKIPVDIIAKVEPPKLPDVKPPPPPPPDLQKPPPPYVPPPDVVIQNEPPPPNAITVQHTISNPPPAPPPRPVGISAPALIVGGHANCAQNFYPPIAVRLDQEGTVTLSVHIGADGSVTSADVAGTSGHDSLDQAGIKCVMSAWRFKPAMLDGRPVAVTREYAIKFVLQGG